MRKHPIYLAILAAVLFSQACAPDEDETLFTENFENVDNDDTPDETDDDIGLEAFTSTPALIADWNALWLQLDRYANGMRPNATARALAYIHLAAYETAVPAFEDFQSHENQFNRLSINRNLIDGEMDLAVALNTCYAQVMNHFMIYIPQSERNSIQSFHDSMFNSLRDSLNNESMLDNSRRWGNHVADRIIEFSQTDRKAEEQIRDPQPISYEPEVGDGYWTYSAEEERGLFPYWGEVRTFVISPEETTTVAPPISYSENPTSAYYDQMFEVYEVNNTAREEDNEQLWIAEFWSDDVEGLMMSPPGRQISIVNQLIDQFDLPAEDILHLLLRLGFSLNDTAVSVWADKYEYLVMRPNVYIQEFIDEDFQTNLFRFIFWPNPTFPGYPSGHSAFASAAAGVFINEFGDTVDFTDRSHEGRTEFRGAPRQFGSFSAMAEENAYSRIPLGVHIRMDCEEGLRLGYEIAEAVNQTNIVQ